MDPSLREAIITRRRRQIRRGRPSAARRAQRVQQQTGDRHRPDAAGHRGNRAGDLTRFGRTSPTRRGLPPSPGTRLMPTSITIAPGLIQSPRTISGVPMAATSKIGAPAHRRQIARLGMGDGDGGVLGEQQLRHRLADDVGAADHHRLHAGERGMHRFRQPHAAERRARHQRRQAARQPPDIERVEAVHVLGRVDGGDDLVCVDLRRQRQLHQDAVDVGVGVELAE